ncbi:MAG: NTP transferase domain-containing protein, partial [Chloroflexi bacterium]|nr:NTP transferase domain-containing protein [Chloroflexota bacterium]
MKAAVLAAGEGKRMSPLTDTRPKVMLPVANKPILEHLVIEMREAGVDEFLFVVGYHGETIREYFRDGSKWNVSVQYVTQKRQLGTADAVRQVSWWAGERFVLANGDVVVGRDDVRTLMLSPIPAMGVSRQEDVSGLGVVELHESRIVRIHEKVRNPPGNLVNTGLYVMTREIFAAINDTRPSSRGEYELTDSLQLLIDRGTGLGGYAVGRWLNFTYPWDLLAANELLLRDLAPDIQGEVEPGASIRQPLALGKGSVVRAGSYIIGPAIIGEGCEIGPNCYIRPSTAIADGCHVGASVEIKNSIMMAGARAPHHNY